ncbi:MAG: PduL/EutD family phosphate acyltransferase [Candidatus Nanoarchaeia archaeon]|nr:PduL/EutD family phosphate acyltransferase [Candidatus Nanoarchaeia archaeon]
MNKVKLGISNRHAHLTREHIDKLFGKSYSLNVKKYLMDKENFAAEETVILKKGDFQIENVRIIGPERLRTQIEILESDQKYLDIESSRRDSGDLKETPGLTIIGPKGTVELCEGVILARTHIHLIEEEARKLGLINKKKVKLMHPKKGLICDDATLCIIKDGSSQIHMDKEEAKKFDLGNDEELIIS